MIEWKKPPLGIMPKEIWDLKRYNELRNAIYRHLNENFPIPNEWITEYNELCKRVDVNG